MQDAYAQVLWTLIEKGKAPHEAVAAIKKELAARGRTALLPKIGKAFERLAAKEANKNSLTLSVARTKDAKAAIKEVEKLLAVLKIENVDLCEKTDDALIGGWRLEGRGVLVDNSWKSALLSIYNGVLEK